MDITWKEIILNNIIKIGMEGSRVKYHPEKATLLSKSDILLYRRT
jgi:hypothetical protein